MQSNPELKTLKGSGQKRLRYLDSQSTPRPFSPVLAYVVVKLMVEDDQASANQLFGYGLGIWLGLYLFVAILGRTLKDTANNLRGLLYLGVAIVIGVIALGILSFLIPSSCSRDDTADPASTYYRR
mgnify:CR=1 FL=1